jgi:hypothetical protein
MQYMHDACKAYLSSKSSLQSRSKLRVKIDFRVGATQIELGNPKKHYCTLNWINPTLLLPAFPRVGSDRIMEKDLESVTDGIGIPCRLPSTLCSRSLKQKDIERERESLTRIRLNRPLLRLFLCIGALHSKKQLPIFKKLQSTNEHRHHQTFAPCGWPA